MAPETRQRETSEFRNDDRPAGNANPPARAHLTPGKAGISREEREVQCGSGQLLEPPNHLCPLSAYLVCTGVHIPGGSSAEAGKLCPGCSARTARALERARRPRLSLLSTPLRRRKGATPRRITVDNSNAVVRSTEALRGEKLGSGSLQVPEASEPLRPFRIARSSTRHRPRPRAQRRRGGAAALGRRLAPPRRGTRQPVRR